MSKSNKGIKEKLIKGIISCSEKSLKTNANSTTSGWAFQPEVPAKIKNFKK